MSGKKRRTYNNSDNGTLPKSDNAEQSTARQDKSRKISSVGATTTVYAPPSRIEGIGNKIKNNPLFLILCFLVPFIIMGICFIKAGVFPFGERTVLYSDNKAQYFPFLQDLQSKLQNGESLFYTWRTGMGSNFIAMIGYYIASPLNFLTVFIPAKYLSIAMALLIMTKISCASLFTGIFLNKVFRRNDISLVAFGSCYAFCGFMMGYYWNVIWLDCVALLPLIALGVYNLVYLKKYKLYIITLAIAMTANYYIGYMLCLFVAMWFFMLWIKYPKNKAKKEMFIKSLLSIIGYSVIAIGISAIIVVPSAIQLGNTVASNDVFPKEWEFYHSMFDIVGNALGFHNPVTMQGLPNVYCGIICLLMAAVFIRSPKISTAEKIVDLSFIMFLLISLNFNVLDYLWHGLHFPNQIPHRFAFILAFFLIIIAYRAFSLAEHLTKDDVKAIAIASIVMLSLGLIATMNKDEYNTMESKSVALSAMFIVFYIFVILLKVYKFVPQKVFCGIISLVIIAEMASSCYIGVQTVGTSNMDYPNKQATVQELVDYANDNDDEKFYRVEMTDISSKNDGAYYGHNAISQFSSTSDKNVLNFMGKIGITAKRSSWHYMQTSPLVTSLFNIKYIVSRDGYTANDTTLEYMADKDEATLNSYKYYLPLGFMMNKDIANMQIDNYGYAYDAQNDLFRLATGLEGQLYTEFEADSYEISNGTITPREGGRTGEYTYESESTPDVTFTYTVPKDGMVYAYANFRDCSKRIEVISNTNSRSVDIDARRYVFPAGNYKAGDTITFKSNLNLKNSGTVRLFVATFDEELYKQGYELLNDETLNITNFKNDLIEGKINVKTDGVMWTSVPYEEGGWTVYVDGKEAEITPLCGAFVGIKLTAGEHDIKLKYAPPGFTVGVLVTAVSVLAFVVLCVFDLIRKKKEKTMQMQEE